MNYEKFNKNDWAHLHDVVINSTWDTGKLSLNQEQLESLYTQIPEELTEQAEKWGMNDTVFRDNLSIWLKENPIYLCEFTKNKVCNACCDC